MSTSKLITNIGELVTLAPLAEQKKFTGIADADLGRIKQAWLAVDGGRVLAYGAGEPDGAFASLPFVDAMEALIIPGLVDSHTHLLFGGSRAREFWMRLSGTTYQEIAAAGGGIQNTVKGSREASDESLEQSCYSRMDAALRLGITTMESKSGYGLNVAEELRHLRVLNKVARNVPQTLSVTCLALHAASPEHDSLASYVADVTQNLLPVVAEEKLATWVDAFIEDGYFSVADVEPYVTRAKELGLGVRLHADEFSDAGAAGAAARWGAASADHLQFAADEAIAAMAKAGTVATILPGTSLYTNIPFAQGSRFVDAGVPLAIATDFNPGSCRLNNLAQMMTLASLHGGVKPATAFAGGTYVAARALRLEERKGHLSKGADADLAMYDLPDLETWFADMGQTHPREVMIEGATV